ncbi:MAG: hypothetical protein RJA76_22 [Bacteroidota bacterium]|jgi:hypothetical protein
MYYLYFVLFISFILLNLKISSKISTNNFSEIIITGFIIYACSLTVTGYFLSFFNFWHSPFLWSILPFFSTYSIYLFFKNFEFIENRKSTFKLFGRNIQKIDEEVKASSQFQKRLFQLLFIFLIILFLSLIIGFFVNSPNEWDSMTGHLNRILYFIQNGNTKFFIGTNWNIDTYPKSFPNHQVYPFLMTHKNEMWFKFHNLSSYIISGFSFYGIMKRLNYDFKTRLITACFYLFIPIAIIQSTTTDTDIVLASYLSVLIYFIISYFDQFEKRYILLSALTFSIALAHKITFLFTFPSLLLLLVFLFFKKRNEKPLRNIRYIISSFIICFILIVLPCGYLSNILHYRHPIGPKIALEHQSIERARTFDNLLEQGSRNLLRYSSDLLNLDGLRNIESIEKINSTFKKPFEAIDKKLNLRLESEKDFTIIPFSFNRKPIFFNGTPIMGIMVIFYLCSILFVFFEPNKNRKQISLFLLGCFIIHFLILSFTAAYDPWKGRYMQSSFVFLLPIGGILIEKILYQKKLLIQIISFVFFLLVGFSGIITALLHNRALLVPYKGQKTIFQQSRIEKLTISRPDIKTAYQNFDIIVPNDAVVAIATINDDYEYPLWGKSFSRKLIPINPFGLGLQPIPKECNYLFFTSQLIKPIKGDIDLSKMKYPHSENIIVPGENYYLRKLK